MERFKIIFILLYFYLNKYLKRYKEENEMIEFFCEIIMPILIGLLF